MILFNQPMRWSRVVLLAIGLIVSGIALSAGASTYEARGYSEPAIYVLGAGDGLSLLVTDGPARFLLAAGDDSTALGNALSTARPFGRSRIDIVVLAGTAGDVTFLSRVHQLADARHIDVAGPEGLAAQLGLPDAGLTTSLRRFRLTPETAITVETVERPEDEPGPAFGWRATVVHGDTRIVALSDGQLVDAFSVSMPFTALIVGGREPLAAFEASPTQVLIVRGNAATDEQLRQGLRELQPDGTWVIRVFEGEAKRFALTENGLALPSSATQISATPRVD